MPEKKELKEKDIKNVSGGDGGKTAKTCPHCNKEYFYSDMIIKDKYYCCPHCEEKLYQLLDFVWY